MFFGEEAVTFDQAPFRNAALNLLVKYDFLTYLRDNGVSEDILAPLNTLSADDSGLESRDGNITWLTDGHSPQQMEKGLMAGIVS